ncbi:MAG: hypothetical protein HZB41_13040 [Ignavibacteriae bacterium]|nr:hypothetical protein [Ignavibacteriota bacterium]
MKNRIYLITLLSLFVIILFSCGKDEAKKSKPEMTPLDYNDAIIAEQTKIINTMLELSNSFNNSDVNVMDDKLEGLNKQTSKSIEVLENMEPYEGNNELRASALELFKFYESLSEKEFDEMVEILKKKNKITNDDITRMGEINKSIVERETILDRNLSQAQHSFALKYNFTVEKNKLQNKIDSMGK